jgi:hypothetical protein
MLATVLSCFCAYFSVSLFANRPKSMRLKPFSLGDGFCLVPIMSSKRVFLLVVSIAAMLLANTTAQAQGTAFTYQGSLSDGGRPANGSYDLQFTIYDSATNGTNVSATITNLATGVSNGLFTFNLDFGSGIFSGPARWLEIAVRTNGYVGSFFVLTPRQLLAPSPYAITAATVSGAVPASQLTGTLASPLLGGVYTGAVVLSNAANSFVGDASGVTNVQASKLAGAVQIPNGGTGQTTASAALSALGGASLTANQTISGVNNISNTGNTLGGNAQGGAVTNLDFSYKNIWENQLSLPGMVSTMPQGGVVYIPGIHQNNRYTNLPFTVNTNFAQMNDNNQSAALTIKGSGSRNSVLQFYGGNTNFIDQYNAALGFSGINLQGLALWANVPGGGMSDFGYVSPPGCGTSFLWNDVTFSGFLDGVVEASSGSEFDNIQGRHNGVFFTVGLIGDGTIINCPWVDFSTNAAFEINSRGNRLWAVGNNNNNALVIGSGGGDDIQIVMEHGTNAVVEYGYTNWPFSTVNTGYLTQYAGNYVGNGGYIAPNRIHDAYYQGWSANAYPFAFNNAAVLKDFNTSATPRQTTFEDLDASSSYMPMAISYTATGDTSIYKYKSVKVGATNLMTFSDGTSIPSQDGMDANVNLAQEDFTHATLMRKYFTNGNEFLRGTITVGALAFTNASGATTIAVDTNGGGFGATCTLSNSDDNLQLITYNTTVTAANQRMAVVTFANPKTTVPRAVFCGNLNAGDTLSTLHAPASYLYYTNFTVNSYEIWQGTSTLTSGTTYIFSDLVVQ